MKTRLKKRVLLGIASVGLLLGTAWMAQAAITITLDNGTVCTYGTITLDANGVPVSASCSASPTFILSVSNAGGTGSGKVTSSPAGIDCGTDCSQTYPDGTAVTLTAAPATGSTFTGWSGGCTGTELTCTVNMNANQTVNATFNLVTSPPPPPPPGACGTLPANTVVIDTGDLNVSWPQAVYLPPPQQITAFKVKVPSTFTGRDSFAVATTASSSKSKLLVVSACPGVLTPVGSACSLSGTDTTTVRLSGKASDASYYCKLTPGETYYVNAVSKYSVTDTGYNCTTPTNCSFYASRSAPY